MNTLWHYEVIPLPKTCAFILPQGNPEFGETEYCTNSDIILKFQKNCSKDMACNSVFNGNLICFRLQNVQKSTAYYERSRRIFCYHPKTKFAKVMFLHVSVYPRGGGIGGIEACIAGGIPACLAADLHGGVGCIPECFAGFQAHTQRGS